MSDEDYETELKKVRKNAEQWLNKLLRAANGLGKARKRLKMLHKKRKQAEKVLGKEV